MPSITQYLEHFESSIGLRQKKTNYIQVYKYTKKMKKRKSFGNISFLDTANEKRLVSNENTAYSFQYELNTRIQLRCQSC